MVWERNEENKEEYDHAQAIFSLERIETQLRDARIWEAAVQAEIDATKLNKMGD